MSQQQESCTYGDPLDIQHFFKKAFLLFFVLTVHIRSTYSDILCENLQGMYISVKMELKSFVSF